MDWGFANEKAFLQHADHVGARVGVVQREAHGLLHLRTAFRFFARVKQGRHARENIAKREKNVTTTKPSNNETSEQSKQASTTCALLVFFYVYLRYYLFLLLPHDGNYGNSTGRCGVLCLIGYSLLDSLAVANISAQQVGPE